MERSEKNRYKFVLLSIYSQSMPELPFTPPGVDQQQKQESQPDHDYRKRDGPTDIAGLWLLYRAGGSSSDLFLAFHSRNIEKW